MAKPGMRSKETIESLKERMSRDPLSRAFLQLAEEYRKEGRYDEAARVCMEGLSRHPTYHTARISLGRTYLEAGDLDSARRALSEVLELAPENHLAGKLLAEVQRRMGDLPGAAETYRAILRHYPGDREIEALLRDLQAPKGATAAAEPAAPPVRAGAAPSPAAAAPARTGVKVPAPAPSPHPPGPIAEGPSAARRPPALPVPGPAAAPRAADPSLDYRPEDVARAATAPANGAAPSPGRGGSRGVQAGADALQTNTLAELYLRQGLVDKAIEVYRAMLRVDPENEKARRRLSELAPGDGGPRQPAAQDVPVGRAPAQAGPARAPATPASRRDAREAIARLERWLRSIRAGARGGREAGAR